MSMRWLAALIFLAVSLAALAARLYQPAVNSLPTPLSLVLSPLETAPLLALPDRSALAAWHPFALKTAASGAGDMRQVTILLAGDTGLNSSFQPVQAGFVLRHGTRLNFEATMDGIAPLVSGDINFANLETVVTDGNHLPAASKMFGFRTHPEGVRALAQLGFNVFSVANNHALDYGPQGAGETLRHLGRLGIAHAGLGRDADAAAAPALIERRGVRVALGAIGIGGGGFGPGTIGKDRAGQLAFSDANLARVTANLAAADADVRILSVHYGTEFNARTPASERQRLRQAAAAGADIIAGHHHHVAAGVELVDGKAVFYGLGNFLHLGTQDMGRHGLCHDYGLVARVHLSGPRDGPLAVRAIEAIPLTDMHVRPRPLDATAAAERIHVLNTLSAQLGPNGVRFAIAPDGTGLYCAAGADRLEGSIGVRCTTGRKAEAPPAALAQRIEAACGRQIVRAVALADEGASPGAMP